MNFEQLHKSWEQLGATDPRWAILSEPSRKGGGGDDASFWQSGVGFVGWLAQHIEGLGVVQQRRRALDFGCGHGRLTQALAPYFEAVVGVDIAESMLAAARLANKHGEKVTYLHNPRADLSLLDTASFDFVLTMLVLQHMRPDYAKTYVREFLRLLRPGGIAFFQLPVESLTPKPEAANVSTPATTVTSPTALCASSAIVPTRINFVGDEPLWLRVDLHNHGPNVWRAGAGPGRIELGVRFQRLDLSSLSPPAWFELPHDVPPGKRVEVVVAVHAPAVVGHFVLSALPAVGREWCEHPANVAANTTVRIVAVRTQKPPPPPRPPFQRPDKQHGGLIEVHGTTLSEVDAVVREGGGRFLDVGLDGWAGHEWVSAHFTVQKR